MEFSTLRGTIGIALILIFAFLVSTNRGKINFRTVGTAFLLQLALGAIVLYWPPGKEALYAVSKGVTNVLGYGYEGIKFLFGSQLSNGGGTSGFVFAFMVLPMIIFVSSLVAVLYYIGVMDFIIKFLGGGLQMLTKTSRPESLSAAANIFLGQTEAPLSIRPFLPTMTKSELFAVMVGGLSTVAGSVIAGYIGVGIELKYLIAASFMAAPGGLLMAKMILPETEEPKQDLEDLAEVEDGPVNVIDAAARGASDGLSLALNVGAMLLAFVALIALLNGALTWIGGWTHINDLINTNLTLNWLLGKIFQPVAWALGIPWSEAATTGSFIGQKLVVNEFVAYLNFAQVKDTLTIGTQVFITFALCGFANLSSIAILVGGLGGIAPNRRGEIAELGLKAVLAATLANLMSATIAGVFTSLA